MYDKLIQASQLSAHLKDDGWLIFDCRFDLADTAKGEKLYNVSHIPGAIYAHLDLRLSSPITPTSGRHPMPTEEELVAWLADCGLQEQSQVVVYDDSGGVMASRLWWLLKCLGHQAVALLDGGWQAWQAGSLLQETHQAELSASDFSASLNREYMVETEAVVNNLQTREFQLIDVRVADRFSGKLEPIDPIAGHIPGAINRPLTDNLDERGYFRSEQAFSDYYGQLAARWNPWQQVYMCGSGVTACHSVLAMVVAGFGMPRVYTGSWSEWIRDTALPIATGPE